MKRIIKSLALACLATATVAAVPAAAQVQGNIATINAPGVIINTNAFKTAYQQVGTTYKTQLDTMVQRNNERQTLLQQLDTNKDNQLDEAEQQAAQNSQQATRINQIDQELGQLSNQVDRARVYAIEQILRQYSAALQEVVTQRQIQMVIAPDAVVYAPTAANITQQVATSLNAKVPSVQITPPQDWQPSRNAVGMYQQIQQALMTASAIQQAQAQQQPAAQPATNGR